MQRVGDSVSLRSIAESRGHRIPIGRPIWNTRVYVLGSGLEAVAFGCAGGALHRGSWCCAGLSGAFGPDVGAVCRGPVWGAREPDVPDRGPGALAFGRRSGVPGSFGCADQASRVTGSSLARSRRRCLARRGCRRRRLWSGRTVRASAVLWATWWARLWFRFWLGFWSGRSFASGCAVGSSAGVSGAVVDRGAGCASADAERQA